MVTLYFDLLSSPQLLDFQQNRPDPQKWSLAACGTVENLAKGAVRSGWTKQNESGTIMWRGSWPQIFWRPGENPTYLFSATTCGGRCRVYHPWPLETSDLCRVRASTRERWWVGLKSQPLVSEPAQPNNRRIWRNSRQRGPGEKNLGVGFDPGRSFHSGFPSLLPFIGRGAGEVPLGEKAELDFTIAKQCNWKWTWIYDLLGTP